VEQATPDQSFGCQLVGLGKAQNNALEREYRTASVILSLFVLEWLSRVVLSGRPLYHGLRSLAHDSRTGAKESDRATWAPRDVHGCRRVRNDVERKGTRPLSVGR
jgi:hypothetical protein